MKVEDVAFEEGIVAKLDCHIVGRFFKVGPENVCFWNKEIQLDSYFLARDLEVLKSIYLLLGLAFQTNTILHQNINYNYKVIPVGTWWY